MNKPHPPDPQDSGIFSRDERKTLIKEAIKELLDEKAAQFGRFTLKWLGTALLLAGLYAYLWVHGWQLPRS